MKKQLLTWIFALLPAMAWAASVDVPLDRMKPDHRDQSSLQRGAQVYMNYCMGCHGLQFSRYERVADDLGIPHDLYLENLVFDPDHQIGDLMVNAMSAADGKRWFGVAPADLTLVARVHGTDWLYTYLRTFYRDDTRPYGVNNLVFPDVGMPHALVELQGLQECAPGPVTAGNRGVLRDPLTREDILYDESGEPLNPCGRFTLVSEGALTPAEYDELVYDLVNFLDYTAEPMKLQRQRMGIYVLMFVALFFVFAYLLNREYWKDVH